MRILIAGATGFVGRALVAALQRDGHVVVAWARSTERARSFLGATANVLPITDGDAALVTELARCEAVVNVAGESIAGGRWTAARRRQLVTSRVDLTKRIVKALAGTNPRPKILISASAVGYYGDRGAETLTEQSSPGNGFLAELAVAWEAAAASARNLGLRVVQLRSGVVLGRNGGALARMLPIFRLGLGGRVGSGRQYFPWIHLRDEVGVISTALIDPRYEGPINLVAPDIVTNRDFTKALGRALGRPAVFAVPAFALKLALGELSDMLLGGQRVQPKRLLDLGYPYGCPEVEGALRDIVSAPPVPSH
jgi:uncharacterized protein (TIGR01777 family)